MLKLNNIFKNKYFRYSFLLSIFFIGLSYLAYLFPLINTIGFFVCCLMLVFFSLKDLRLGALLIFAELFSNSNGYLFTLTYSGANISLRIAFFILFFSVYFSKILSNLIEIKVSKKRIQNKDYLKKVLPENISSKFNYLKIFKTKYFKYLLFFAVALIYAVGNGFLKGNLISNIFADSSGFLFFIYIIPLFDLFNTKEKIKDIFYILFGVFTSVFIQTMVILWMYAHEKIFYLNEIYRWITDFSIGEITRYEMTSFYRIFFQSYIYFTSVFVFGIVYFLYYFLFKKREIRFRDFLKQNSVFIGFLFLISIIFILCFSRSYWLASVLTVIFIACLLLILTIKEKRKFSDYIKSLLFTGIVFLILLVTAFGSITLFITYPKSSSSDRTNMESILRDRLSDPKNESAGSSRMNMLDPLFTKIKQHIFAGSGLGTTIIYKSADPTNIKKTIDGMYETYALEWGYFDLFLKFGLFGFLVYMMLLGVILIDFVKLIVKDKENRMMNLGLLACFIYLLAINLTTPYLNRPVGITTILISLMWLQNQKIENKKQIR